MLISILAFLNSFYTTPKQVAVVAKNPAIQFYSAKNEWRNKTNTDSKKTFLKLGKFHASPRKIYLRNFHFSNRAKKSAFTLSLPKGEISKKKTTPPWNGHFSAKNFRSTQADNLYLEQIKQNLRTSIIALPKWHTQVLKDLEVQKNKNISRGLSNSRKIILHTSSIQNQQELIAVFVHEMGHITDLGALKGKKGHKTSFYDGKTPILNDDLSLIFYQISWKTATQKKNSAKKSDFVSGYASSDCFEDFAETYLFYRLHGEKFRGILRYSPALKKKYEFMKRYVFKGQEFELNKPTNYKFPYLKVFDATLLSFDKKDL